MCSFCQFYGIDVSLSNTFEQTKKLQEKMWRTG